VGQDEGRRQRQQVVALRARQRQFTKLAMMQRQALKVWVIMVVLLLKALLASSKVALNDQERQ
jgi:hypothetical protein